MRGCLWFELKAVLVELAEDDLRANGLCNWEERGVGGALCFNYTLAFALQPGKITDILSQDGREVLCAHLGTDLVTSVRTALTGLLSSSRFKIRGWHMCLPGCRFRRFPASATFLSKPSVSVPV